MDQQQTLRDQLYASYRHRAMLYWLIFDELRGELGAERAAELLKRAIYRRGQAVGAEYARYAPDDLAGLERAFTEHVPDGGRMFAPETERLDAEGLDLTLQSCPLRDAWQEAGLADEEVATMCSIAAEIDLGMFEGAGFTFSAETWQPGQDGCCHLHVRPGK